MLASTILRRVYTEDPQPLIHHLAQCRRAAGMVFCSGVLSRIVFPLSRIVHIHIWYLEHSCAYCIGQRFRAEHLVSYSEANRQNLYVHFTLEVLWIDAWLDCSISALDMDRSPRKGMRRRDDDGTSIVTNAWG